MRFVIKQIVERREVVGMSQETLARKVGTTQSAIARLESGRTNPHIATLIKIAGALGKNIELR